MGYTPAGVYEQIHMKTSYEVYNYVPYAKFSWFAEAVEPISKLVSLYVKVST